MSSNKKELGLMGAISIVIGTVIGASIFILLGSVASQSGPSLFIAYIIGFIPALFASMIYAQLGSAIPNVGGSYSYTKELLSPRAGYLVATTLMLGGIGAIVMLAIGFAQYLQFFFPNISITLVATLIVVTLYFLNLLGLKLVEMIQIVMTIWIILSLFLFAIPGIPHVNMEHFQPLMPNGLNGLLFGSVLAVYSYLGVGIISELGGEIKNPKRNLPLAIFISLAIILVLYVLVSFVTIGVMPWQELASSGASITEAGQFYLPQWAIYFISIGALFATVTTINAIMLAIPRDFFVLEKDGILKQYWTSIKFKDVPVLPLTMIMLVSIICIFTGLSADYFATITVVGLLFNAVLLAVAAWNLPKKRKAQYAESKFKLNKFSLYFFVIGGIVLNTLFILLAALDLPSILVIFIVWTLGGYLMVHKRIKRVPRQEQVENLDSHM